MHGKEFSMMMDGIPSRQRVLCFATLALTAFTMAGAIAVTATSIANATAPRGTTSGDIVSGTGTVRFLSFEGGFYGIVADDGNHYDPSAALRKEFQVDGLRVFFEARILHNMLSFHMWGQVVEIITIYAIA